MNSEELEVLLHNAVKDYCQPHTIRESEDRATAALRQSAGIRENFDQLKRFVSADEYHASCLQHAAKFISAHEYRAALHTCLSSYWDSQNQIDFVAEEERKRVEKGGKMAEMATTLGGGVRGETLQQLAHRIQGRMHTSVCRFFLRIEGDPHMESPPTLEYCVKEATHITDAMQLAFPHDEALYHLIYNGTIYLYQCCQALMSKRFFKQAAVFLGWAARCCDSVIKLSTTKYLRWRVRLYTTLALCYEGLEEGAGAHAIAQQMQHRVEDLYELQMLDVVPPSSEEIQELQLAQRNAKLLTLRTSWCAEKDDHKEEVATGKEKGKGKTKEAAATDSLTGTPTTGLDLLEKIKNLYAEMEPAEGAAETVEALLTIAGDGATRLFSKSETRKSLIGALAAEALALYMTPLFDAYARKHDLSFGGDVSESEASEKIPEPTKGAKAKNAKPPPSKTPVKTEEETPAVELTDALRPLTRISFVNRVFVSHHQDAAFEKSHAVQQHLQETVPQLGCDEVAKEEASLLNALMRVKMHEDNKSALLLEATTVLDFVLRQGVLVGERNDLIEDGALFLLNEWKRQPYSHELEGAANVFSVAVRALCRSSHLDALLIGHTALTAVELMSADKRTNEALHVARMVSDLLEQRQVHYVFNHDSTGITTDTTAEVFSKDKSATTQDGIWLRTVKDLRTQLYMWLCKLRITLAVSERHSTMVREHEQKLQTLRDREANSHLLGKLSMKEEHAAAAAFSQTVQEPLSVKETELKLLAWASGNLVGTALAHMEISNRQATIIGKRKSLEEALKSLEQAHKNYTALNAQLVPTDAHWTVEATGGTDLSIFYAWSMFCNVCGDHGIHDLVDIASKFLFDRFVSKQEEAPTWNRNLSAWDSLRVDAVEKCSSLMLQTTASALLAIGRAKGEGIDFIEPTAFEDDEEHGLDERRYELRTVQVNRMRCANVILHALEMSIGASHEGTMLRACHALYNAVLPVLVPRKKSTMVLRPIMAILNAFEHFEERRWSDGPLQLLAIRVLQAGFDATHTLSEGTAKSIIQILTNSFIAVWQRILHNPNVRQSRHILAATKNMKLVQTIVNSGVAAAKEAEPQADVKPAKGKAKEKSAQHTEATKVATSIYFRSELFVGDKLPTELLDLLDYITWCIPAALPVLEAKSEGTAEPNVQPLFPPMQLGVATALQQSPAAAVAKANEFKNDPMYPKTCTALIRELMQRRQIDLATGLVQDAIKEIENRRGVLKGMETDAMQVLYNQWMAAKSEGQDTARMTTRHKAVALLTRKIGEFRKKLAFRKMRELHMQYDLPCHAQLRLHQGSLLRYSLAKEAEKLASNTPVPAAPATLSKPESKKAGGKGSKGGKADPKATSDDNKDKVATPSESEDPLSALKVEIVQTLVRSVVLYTRAFMVQHAYAAMQHTINVVRTMFVESPPSVLQDVLSAIRAAENGSPRGSPTSVGMSVTPQSVGVASPPQAVRSQYEELMKVEGTMKVLASTIIEAIRQIQQGHCNPTYETEGAQPVAVKIGRDCRTTTGLLARTTSLHLWLSPRGRVEEDKIVAADLSFSERLVKIFARERLTFEEKEQWARHHLEKEWMSAAYEIAGQEFDEDEDFGTPLPTQREMDEQDRKRRIRINSAGQQILSSDYSDRFEVEKLGPLRIEEFIRSFLYAVQTMQYAQRKQSATQICLDMNKLLCNKYAVQILPTALNLLNACNANTEAAMNLYRNAYREQVRTQKLIDSAHQAWSAYKETENYKRMLARLANSLQPSRRNASTGSTVSAARSIAGSTAPSASDATETHSVSHRSMRTTGSTVATGAGGGGGSSLYKDLVGQYNNAIQYLRQKHSTELLVKLLHELGHIHLLHRVKQEAERAWCDIVDASLGRVNCVANWRTIIAEGGDQIMAKMGLWKLMVALSALANLAQFSYVENQRSATDACLLAAEMLWRLSSCSLSFAQREWDLAVQGIDELLPHVSPDVDCGVLSELAQGLLYMAQHLLQSRFPLQCITICNLLEHISVNFVRNLELTVLARTLKAQAAAEAGNFNAAIALVLHVTKGRELPEQTLGNFGLTYDVIDKSERQNTTNQGTRGAKPDKAKGKGGEETKKVDDNDTLEYDNSKRPDDETNVRAVEQVFASLNNTTWGLLDQVAQEFGVVLSKRVLLGVVRVLLALGRADPQLGWIANSDATGLDAPAQPAKGGKQDKGGKGQQDQKLLGDGNACSTALGLAEKIVTALHRGRPKTPAEPASKNPRVATPPSAAPPTAAGSLAEEIYIKQQCRWLVSQLWSIRGVPCKAVEPLEEAIAAHNTQEKIIYQTEDLPSFLYAIDGRFVAQVYSSLAGHYYQQNRLDAAVEAVNCGTEIAEQIHDEYTLRELRAALVLAHIRAGRLEEAAELFHVLRKSTESLDWRGIDEKFSTTAINKVCFENDTIIAANLGSVKLLHSQYAATPDEHELKTSVRLLEQRSLTLGFNPTLGEEWACAFQKYNGSVRELHWGLNNAAATVIRKGHLDEAESVLRGALRVALQSDSDRYGHLRCASQLLLAQTLRQLDTPQPTITPIAPTAKMAEQPKKSPPFNTAQDEETFNLLLQAISGNVESGAHDFEALRQAFCEMFLLFAKSEDCLHRLAAYNALRHASTISQMQHTVFHNASVFGEQAVPNVEELPNAIVDDLEEFARRDSEGQTAFLRTSGKPLTKPAATAATVAAYFACLQGRLAVALPGEQASIEAKLGKVRSFLQAKQQLFMPQPMVLDAVPDLTDITTPLRPHSIITQAYPACTSAPPMEIVEGVAKPTLPYVTLLISISRAEEDASKDATDVDKQKAPKGKAGKDAVVEDSAPKEPTEMVVPQCVGVRVDQKKLRTIHAKAKELHTLLVVSSEVHNIDEAIGTENAGGKEAKASKSKDKKAPAEVAAEEKPAAPIAVPNQRIDELKADVLFGFLEMLATAQSGGTAAEKALQHLYPEFTLEAPHVAFLAEMLHPSGGATASSAPQLCDWIQKVLASIA